MMRWLLGAFISIGCLSLASLAWVPSQAPLPRIASNERPVAANQCQDCHAEIVAEFAPAPHAYTLRPGNDPQVRAKFIDRQVEVRGSSYRFELKDDRLYLSNDRFPKSYAVDWVFGSGHHALTPISLVENAAGATELIQLDVSWFADDILGLTPGNGERDEQIPSVGLHHTAEQTRACFGCHSTTLVETSGRLVWDRLLAGVSCQRCHPGSADHLNSGGEVATRLSWKRLSARESIERCGECHRRADEFTDDEIQPEATHLVRFAPVGLVQSACFLAQSDTPPDTGHRGAGRFDCLTCHDPHQPAASDPQIYNQRCLQCHDGQTTARPACPTQPRDSNCLTCHMPKVQTSDHLRFTDHWIRVRQ